MGIHAISTETIEPIAELGLILLLFMIGLEIDLKKLRQTGKAVATVGMLQVPIATALGRRRVRPARLRHARRRPRRRSTSASRARSRAR